MNSTASPSDSATLGNASARRAGPLAILTLAALASLLAGLLALARQASESLAVGHWLLALASLAGAIALVTVAAVCRWMRWHYLTRVLAMQLETKDSFVLCMATLPSVITPFYLLELTRTWLISGKYPGRAGRVIAIWGLERGLDTFVLFILLLVAWDRPSVAIFSLGGLCGGVLVLQLLVLKERSAPALFSTLGFVTTCLAPWLCGAAALLILGAAVEHWPKSLLDTFAAPAIASGVLGIPLDGSRTMSLLVEKLQDGGIAKEPELVASLYRAATTWFCVALGIAVLFGNRQRLRTMVRGRTADLHFNEIAAEYQEQIPEHVRDRLLDRKCGLMQHYLSAASTDHGSPLHGLDIGCGQGWYAMRMHECGYLMVAVDQSAGQIDEARRGYAARPAPRFEVCSAAELPLDDESVDFAYAINVVHHIIDEPIRRGALAEISRVLKPGGTFFLHEINTVNPLFALYMGYVFPLIRSIDEGTERWIDPARLPDVKGARWQAHVDYFTFLPDFVPGFLFRTLQPLERRLEAGPLRSWSAHFMARLVKD